MGRFWTEASESNPAVCPQCGIVGKQGTKFGHLIQRLSIVHFDPPTDIPGVGWNVRACDRTKGVQAFEGQDGIPNAHNVGSGYVVAVNCLECMKTEEYKKAVELDGK